MPALSVPTPAPRPVETMLLTLGVHDAFLSRLVAETECGPFDGGCLVVALSLQRVHGGDIHVVEGRLGHGWHTARAGGTGCASVRPPAPPLIAHHAVLRLPSDPWGPDFYADADGARRASDLLERFSANESAGRFFTDLAIRPIRDGDLSDAPCCPDIVSVLAELLRCENVVPRERHGH